MKAHDASARAWRTASLLGALALSPHVHAQPDPQVDTPAAAPATVRVDRFEVTGNTLLPAPRVEAALRPYEGERTVDELTTAAAAVQALYRDAGYGAVTAYLPRQSLNGGVVRIAVLEGRIGEIRIQGNRHFSDADIRASLPALVPGTTPRVRRLDGQIALGNENPARHVEVLLKPGAAAGQVDADLTVTEQPLQRWTLRADNTGDSRTGHVRVAAGWQDADLSGHDDVLSAELETAPKDPDKVAIASAAYRLPVYGPTLAIDAYGAWSDIDGGTTATAAGGLSFTGRGTVLGARMTASLPRLGEADQSASLGLESRTYRNTCEISGLPDGACGPAGASVTILPLSFGWAIGTAGPTGYAFAATLAHDLLLGAGHGSPQDFEAARPGSSAHYTVLRLNASGNVALPADVLLQGRLAGQFTHDGLVPGEQFGLGGAFSVRGYAERELAGDSGIALTGELASPDLWTPAATDGRHLRLIAFGDAGWIRNRLGTPCLGTRVECEIGSLGLGGRFVAGGFQARLDVARALKTAEITRRGDWRAHFAVSVAF